MLLCDPLNCGWFIYPREFFSLILCQGLDSSSFCSSALVLGRAGEGIEAWHRPSLRGPPKIYETEAGRNPPARVTLIERAQCGPMLTEHSDQSLFVAYSRDDLGFATQLAVRSAHTATRIFHEEFGNQGQAGRSGAEAQP